MAAAAYENGILPFADHLHPLMAVGTAGIGQAGYGFPVTAVSVLAYKELRVLSVDRQQTLSALRTLFIGQIFMPESSLLPADFIDQRFRIGADLLHEILAFQPPFGDIRQLHLPCRRQLRLFQIRRYQFQKLPRLCRQINFISTFFHQKTVEQFFYNIRPCRNGSKPSGLTKHLRHLRIPGFHIPDRILHRGKQSTLGKTRRRFGLSFPHRHFYLRDLLSLLQQRQCLPLRIRILLLSRSFRLGNLTSIQFSPAVFQNPFSLCGKGLRSDPCGHGSLLINARREQDAQKSAHHQVINLSLIRRHGVQLHKLFRRNDRMVIRYFCVIDKRRTRRKFLSFRLPRRLPVRANAHSLQPLPDRRKDIGCQIAGIRAGISEHLMILIKALHQIECLFRGKSEPLACLSLKLRQIIQHRGKGFLFLLLHLLNDQRFLPCLLRDGLRPFP